MPAGTVFQAMLSVIATFFGALGVAEVPVQRGSPGVYDFYVFARFFTTENCGSTVATEEFNLHGLWPGYNKHHVLPSGEISDWPQFCGFDNPSLWASLSVIDQSVVDKFKANWSLYAPDYISGTQQQSLYWHEWVKHGTCATASTANATTSALATQLQVKFFQTGLDRAMAARTPDAVLMAVSNGSPMKLSDLQAAFAPAGVTAEAASNYTMLQCNNGTSRSGAGHAASATSILTMVEFCYGKDASGMPTATRIACPPTAVT